MSRNAAGGVCVSATTPTDTSGGACGFNLSWPVSAALVAQRLAEERASQGLCLGGRVVAHTTPSVADIGAASVCIRLDANEVGAEDADHPCGGAPSPPGAAALCEVDEGGYLLAIRVPGERAFLPAVAGAPGRQGLDRHGLSRVGLAECLVMARPLVESLSAPVRPPEGGERVTFLHEAALRSWLPAGGALEVVLLARLTDFFLGLNAGTWLRIRILDISKAALAWLPAAVAGDEEGAFDGLLAGSGLARACDVELPPQDNSEAWNYWGGGGNTGGSGQVLLRAEAEGAEASVPGRERFRFRHGGVDVAVEQRRSGDRGAAANVDMTGDLVWPTATIFCKYLCDHAPLFSGLRVLDLGAGTGLVGLVCGALGGRVTLTDVPRVLPLLAQNTATAAAEGATAAGSALAAASVRSLWWGDGPTLRALAAEGRFDVVLCCEVVYQQPPKVLVLLRETLLALLRPGGVAVFAYQQRDGSEVTDAEFFESLPRSGLLPEAYLPYSTPSANSVK